MIRMKHFLFCFFLFLLVLLIIPRIFWWFLLSWNFQTCSCHFQDMSWNSKEQLLDFPNKSWKFQDRYRKLLENYLSVQGISLKFGTCSWNFKELDWNFQDTSWNVQGMSWKFQEMPGNFQELAGNVQEMSWNVQSNYFAGLPYIREASKKTNNKKSLEMSGKLQAFFRDKLSFCWR